MTGRQGRVRVAVIVGSRRPGRRAPAVARWVRAGAPESAEVTIIDLDEVALPSLAEPNPPMFGDYALPHTRAWSATVRDFDAFVLVTPEYNHSTSPALANALHHLYHEWHDRAVAFVGYGIEGGVRAVEHLRQVTAELGLAGVGPAVALSVVDDFDADGGCAPRERQVDARRRLWTALLRWAGALRDLRAREAPAEEPATTRPALQVPGVADEPVRQLIERLQTGLDRGAADHYDGTFAADILWGTPYGEVVGGFADLNAAHRSMMSAPPRSPSRYELVAAVAPADDVVVTQVRRRSLGEDAVVPFSEMAMYVLVRRAGHWWVAGGQNTPIRPKPRAS